MIAVHPVFSVAERDRRWGVVRRIMARPQWNLDAIIAPEVGERSYAQYLSQIGGRNGCADVVFPRDPAKPVHAFPGPGGYAPGPIDLRTAIWKRKLANSWCSDGKLVIKEGEGSKSVVESLKTLGLNKPGTRIGIAKLTGSRFDAEGLVPSTYLENLKSGLPGVVFLPIEKWGPDSGPIDEAAMVKGPEEQEVMRQCVAVGEKGIATLLRLARPPKRQADVWLPTMMAMYEETGEEPGRASISLDIPSNNTLGTRTDDPLEEGQVISEEIEGCLQGYKAQVNHSIFRWWRENAGIRLLQSSDGSRDQTFL